MKLSRSYWLSKYILLTTESTVIPDGMQIVEEAGVRGSKVDVLVGSKLGDECVLMIYTDKTTEDKLVAAGITYLGKRPVDAPAKYRDKLKVSFPDIKDEE